MFRRFIKFCVLIVLFITVAGAGAYLTLTFFINDDSNIVVPDLSGRHVVTVLEMLSDFSLNTKIKGMEYSTEVPRYHVLYQDPMPGMEIKPGRDVRVTLSKGPRTIVMPSLKGLTVTQARIVLDENGLAAGRMARVYRTRTAENVILAQFPSPGRTIYREEPVDLLVSLGERPSDFIMPALSGLSFSDAIQRMERDRLVLGSVHLTYDRNRPEDQVVGQSPPIGYRVVTKTEVDLVINRKTPSKTGLGVEKEGLQLLRHRTEPGYLNRHFRFHLNGLGLSMDLIDMYIKPGREIWCLIPTEPNITVLIYEDQRLIRSEVIE